jgi:hypothetical protein
MENQGIYPELLQLQTRLATGGNDRTAGFGDSREFQMLDQRSAYTAGYPTDSESDALSGCVESEEHS